METDRSNVFSRKNASTGNEKNRAGSSQKSVYFISDFYSDDSFNDCQIIENSKSSKVQSWKQRMIHLSNWASILCVIDCTLLPLLTFVLSVLGIIDGDNGNGHKLDWLHAIGHAVALYFVLPGMSLIRCFV